MSKAIIQSPVISQSKEGTMNIPNN